MKMDRKVREISNASLEDCEAVTVVKEIVVDIFLIILNDIIIIYLSYRLHSALFVSNLIFYK